MESASYSPGPVRSSPGAAMPASTTSHTQNLRTARTLNAAHRTRTYMAPSSPGGCPLLFAAAAVTQRHTRSSVLIETDDRVGQPPRRAWNAPPWVLVSRPHAACHAPPACAAHTHTPSSGAASRLHTMPGAAPGTAATLQGQPPDSQEVVGRSSRDVRLASPGRRVELYAAGARQTRGLS